MNPISLNRAAKLYGIPQPTLTRWAQRGLIRTILAPAGNGHARLVEEDDVQRLAAMYKTNPGRGKWTIRQNLAKPVEAGA